jgi:thiopeptide-type bacteriocin biosynthesis protein
MANDPAKRKRHPPATLYRALDFALLRAPLLPVESYLDLGATACARNSSSSLAPVDPQIRRALAIGSPSLLDALDRTLPGDDRAANVMEKLRRFLVRMSTRPTPYGTFAGVALLGWGERTDLQLDGELRTHTRVDMDWLVRYVLALDAQPFVRAQLDWVANSAIWIHHDRVTKGPASRVSIAATPVVCRALEFAHSPVRYDELVERLMASAPAATLEKVERLLQQMWEFGFLRTNLMPPVTIGDPIRWVRERVAPITGGKALCVQLDALQRTIAACDTVAVNEVPAALRKASLHLEMLGQTETRLPLQVDMALGLGGAHLSSAVAKEAARTADLLIRLAPRRGSSSMIEGYRQAFVARYGQDREVPLSELLHPEWGLGPITQYSGGVGRVESGHGARRAETLQYLALRAIREGQLVLDLDEVLLNRLKTHKPEAERLLASIDLNLFVLAESPAAIDSGAFQVLVGPNVGAVSAGRSLGRFSTVLGQRARTALERAARREEEYHSGQIVAELAYMPGSFRSANVTLRPAVRRYEITHGVSAGVDVNHVIPLNQLVVGLRDGRFYVRWPTRDVDVVVASGHMLNISQSPHEYQFLTQICLDGIAQLSSFDWGPASGYAFLPRVQSGRSILSCAQWRLELGSRQEAPVNKAKPFADWFARWRERWLVPRRVYLSATDNRLLYDLDDPAQVEELRGEVSRASLEGQCLLQEALPGPEHAWLPSASGGRHIVELAVSLGLSSDPPKDPAGFAGRRSLPQIVPDIRLRPPGSDWLYLKLYGPRSGEDELLAGAVRSLCNENDVMRMTQGWFFVRYSDPDRHLRLRFRASSTTTEALFSRLCAWASKLVATGNCQKFAFDTYEREVERYGGTEATTLAEALFAIDSRAVAELLARAARVDRVTLMVISLDDLLGSMGLAEPSVRLKWLKQTVDSRKEVSDEYRKKREQLIVGLCQPGRLEPAVGEVLAQRHTALKEVAARLVALQSEDALTKPLSRIYESYGHMHCNRLSSDPALERRVLGLLLRAREAISHRPTLDEEPTLARSPFEDGLRRSAGEPAQANLAPSKAYRAIDGRPHP